MHDLHVKKITIDHNVNRCLIYLCDRPFMILKNVHLDQWDLIVRLIVHIHLTERIVT